MIKYLSGLSFGSLLSPRTIFVSIVLFFCIYFYMYHMPKSKQEPMTGNTTDEAPPNKVNFIPSKKFNGAKKDYVFKMDSKGLGYYLDYKSF
tara:strand:+ start:120 stop:392 length:273 start_codon:yes stop_codon:yes gene_type:complete